MLIGRLQQATDLIKIKMALLVLKMGVAGGNTPPKFYIVICINKFCEFEGIFAIVVSSDKNESKKQNINKWKTRKQFILSSLITYVIAKGVTHCYRVRLPLRIVSSRTMIDSTIALKFFIFIVILIANLPDILSLSFSFLTIIDIIKFKQH